MAIKTSDLNAKLFGKTNKRRVSSPVEAQTAAKEKAQVIELAVAGQETVSFELVKIPAAEVETTTCVFAENSREQSFLNPHALSDILVTLKERGQQYPAVGRRAKDGKIEVLDGSRRRMSCILAKQDFLVYVAEDINTEHAKFLSDVANAHKPLSLYERGREMQVKLDSGEAVDQKALAQMFQCSEALVSGALKAAALPLELLQAYPNVGDLGRPTIVKLHKLFFGLDQAQRDEVVKQCQSEQGSIWQRSESHGVARITKDVTEQLEAWIEDMNPAPVKEKVAKVELVKGKVTYTRKGNAMTLDLKKLDDSVAEDILAFIQDKMA
ncbi:ParB/RepB/Spo0J family partition protein [Vibrio sp. SCSIO 43136]|uniref:ParB/RepB/Spo0J family partition protein n=1 Tax=Vibrio sp. SCSIO 43136 TaxID=2819101 RepID=UPI002074BB52|nr:ParB/RepB/Spo0J family partition protein [Vibrio sp. SCSIO 43136]USD67490.1 ParB/RepB/Spo0J family partition protein [Vibrio sp. SCSIO 43136]